MGAARERTGRWGTAREGTGGWWQQGREQGDEEAAREGIGGAAREGTGRLEGVGTATLPSLLVLKPSTPSNHNFIGDPKGHDFHCQVSCCSFIIKTCSDNISIISVARCHDKINKFTLLK